MHGVEDLAKLKVVQLKERLKAAGLKQSGKKADLIERLQQGMHMLPAPLPAPPPAQTSAAPPAPQTDDALPPGQAPQAARVSASAADAEVAALKAELAELKAQLAKEAPSAKRDEDEDDMPF